MGDSELSDDSKSGDQRPTSEVSSDDLRQTGVWSEDEPASRISIAPDGEKLQARRSSIRPAPASFRPSKREPGQLMRPAMVIHAGDVDPVVPLWDNADPTPSHPSQPSIHAHPRVEPFALADDFAPSNPTASAPQEATESAPSTALESAPNAAPDAAAARATSAAPIEDQASEPDATARATDSRSGNATVPRPAPLRAMPIRSAPAEPGERLPLHRNTLSHFGAPNRGSRPDASAKAALTVEASADDDAVLPVNEIIPPPNSSDSNVQDAPATGRRRSGAYIAVILSAVILAGVFVAMMVGRSGTVATPGVAPSVAVSPKTGEAAAPSAVVQEASAELVSAAPAAAAESAAPSAPVEAPPEVANPSAPAPAASPPNAVRVTLDVRPTDSKVIYQGRLQPGPPYEFEVTKGKRMALEVVRFGFVTQKVVLDGRKPVVLVGLRRAPTHSH